jgi:hypothetical protein
MKKESEKKEKKGSEKKGSGLEISALICKKRKLIVEKLCFKCGYQRKSSDTAPETEHTKEQRRKQRSNKEGVRS